MAGFDHSREAMSKFDARFQDCLSKQNTKKAPVFQFEAPGVLDVMGGIGEYSGSLVVTGAAEETQRVAVWATDSTDVTISSIDMAGQEHNCGLPSNLLSEKSSGDLRELQRASNAACGDWAYPVLATIRQAIIMDRCPAPKAGMHILIGDGFAPDADLGRDYVRAVAALRAVMGLTGGAAENLALAEIVAQALQPIYGAAVMRTAITALLAPPKDVLLQLRMYPQTYCDELALPQGVVVRGISTRLGRPTTRQRMLETRLCATMGHRIILDLLRRDGVPVDTDRHCLSSITPQEFVEKFRDRIPAKITRDKFVRDFGDLKGLDGEGANSKGVYKARSRAEHHVYENKRVHDFATALARAGRTDREAALNDAGEFMYASHWSYSQRCGIGGVEADRLVKMIRECDAPGAVFYGAKVTSGGAGGELVVLMRDDDASNQALDKLIEQAAADLKRDVLVHHPLPAPREAAVSQDRSASEALKSTETSNVASSIAASA